MPAEWEPHEATWMAWPVRERTWKDKFPLIPEVIAVIGAVISRGEKLKLVVQSEEVEAHARQLLNEKKADLANVEFHRHPTNDSWIRDNGPIFVEETYRASPDTEPIVKKVALDWAFNAWGEKYPPWDDDNALPLRLAAAHDWTILQPGMVLEGGSIDVNGVGCLLTTEACLLNPNRNPAMSREEIEATLQKWLGVEKILWLHRGIVGDDTDGHIDDIARFVNSATLVIAQETYTNDENYALLRENKERLESMTDTRGNSFEIIDLPMPQPLLYNGERIPATYSNFLITNAHVLVPVFNQPSDAAVLDLFRQLWPDRCISGINVADLVVGGGAIHCQTQQEPAIP
jgi:agmatine deiminase